MALDTYMGVDLLTLSKLMGQDLPDAGPVDGSDQYPTSTLDDTVTAASSIRAQTNAAGHATPFSDGTYTQIDASLSADASGIFMFMPATNTGSVNNATALEFATGAGGAESFWAAVAAGYRPTNTCVVPGFIAAGTRVAVRVRSAISAQAVNCNYSFIPADKGADPIAPVTMGYVSGLAQGQSLTAPGSLNSKGAWTEIEDSTSADFTQLMVNVQANSDSDMSATGVLVDIGIGAAAAESAIISDIYFAYSSTEFMTPRSPLTYGVDIPAGSRLSARFARANASNECDVFLVGA